MIGLAGKNGGLGVRAYRTRVHNLLVELGLDWLIDVSEQKFHQLELIGSGCSVSVSSYFYNLKG
jgi:hypothetical protein